ncbi:hypothetical protein [Haloarchaeobius iranensis]|uniref:Uncharacterized protein n=1 Tax=Haloarchaeobius iranensis TaxID=996166 RepID=A0A1G9VHI6_9EURY|nr:hypothetical protein [Haloarchaeobius iranensis]SDM71609.1 hypothetical protein SAMN05192554_106117 [Haloarchaeobius iranensis]
MGTTRSTTAGIDYEPVPVSNLARFALPLLLFTWAGLLPVVVAGLVFGVRAIGASL